MTRNPDDWMWQRAAELLERADQVQRHFFQIVRTAGRPLTWEPPVDVFETDEELAIIVALPGVEAADIEVGFDRDSVSILARRTLPATCLRAAAAVRRLEIPQGRFQRRIALPFGRYELAERQFQNGCLILRLSKHEDVER
jgi:HSP20 family molecular chaperone IbpA